MTAHPAYFQQARLEVLPFLPQRVERMLDVGCGEGAFSAHCKQLFSCESWGIERHAPSVARATPRLDRVLVGDAVEQAAALPDRHFDLVVCNDVLEHLVEPEALLVHLARALRGEGVLVCSIPNIRYYKALKTILINGDFPREEYGIFDRTHLRFFTHKSIRAMFDGLGYRLERIEGINASRGRAGFALLRALTFGAFDDCRFSQFVCVARPPILNAGS